MHSTETCRAAAGEAVRAICRTSSPTCSMLATMTMTVYDIARRKYCSRLASSAVISAAKVHISDASAAVSTTSCCEPLPSPLLPPVPRREGANCADSVSGHSESGMGFASFPRAAALPRASLRSRAIAARVEAAAAAASGMRTPAGSISQPWLGSVGELVTPLERPARLTTARSCPSRAMYDPSMPRWTSFGERNSPSRSTISPRTSCTPSIAVGVLTSWNMMTPPPPLGNGEMGGGGRAGAAAPVGAAASAHFPPNVPVTFGG